MTPRSWRKPAILLSYKDPVLEKHPKAKMASLSELLAKKVMRTTCGTLVLVI